MRPAADLPRLSCPQMKSVAHLPWKAFTYKVSVLLGGTSQWWGGGETVLCACGPWQ